MRDAVGLVLVVVAGVAAAAAVAAGLLAGVAVAVVGVGTLVAARLGTVLANDADRAWLPLLFPVAFLAKMAGSAVRYLMVAVYYGYGDAFAYHRTGVAIAPIWRSLEVPTVSRGSFGTQVTAHITGLLYVPVTPPMFAGFLMFATLSFVGMVAFYLAFRRVVPHWGAFPYFVLLFFLPTMIFWPSSIGKDALLVLGLGLASLGTALAFARRHVWGPLLMGAGIGFAALIRPHVAVIAVGAMVLAVLLARASRLGGSRSTRIVVATVALVALVYLVPLASARLGVDQGLDTFLQEQQRRTSQGGSAVVGKPATSPLDLPEATLRVLFRPLPYEASSPAMLLSSAESLLLLGMILWRLPTMWANRAVVRRVPYLLYALGFTGAFVVAFSAIFNLGIIARQRSQVVPFLLALVVGLGWRRWAVATPTSEPEEREERMVLP